MNKDKTKTNRRKQKNLKKTIERGEKENNPTFL